MSTVVMIGRIAEASPRSLARMAGVFYLLAILTGVFAQGFISERLVVSVSILSLASLGPRKKRIEANCSISGDV